MFPANSNTLGLVVLTPSIYFVGFQLLFNKFCNSVFCLSSFYSFILSSFRVNFGKNYEFKSSDSKSYSISFSGASLSTKFYNLSDIYIRFNDILDSQSTSKSLKFLNMSLILYGQNIQLEFLVPTLSILTLAPKTLINLLALANIALSTSISGISISGISTPATLGF